MATMPARGSLRSRAAATVSGLTLRQLSAVLPPDQAWGLWLSRRIVARIMDTFGPSLRGVRVDRIDTRLPDGRRLVGEWVRGAGVGPPRPGRSRDLLRPRQRIRPVLHAYPPPAHGMALHADRTARLQRRLPPRAAAPIPHRRRRCPDRLGLADPGGARRRDDHRRGLRGRAPGRRPAPAERHRPPGRPGPALSDLTFARARECERLRRDPAIRSRDARRLVELYCAAVEPAHPRWELAVTTGRRLPATLIQAGGAEMLAGDAKALAADIRAASGQCELQVWPDQVHVFQALPRLTPEAVAAMREIAAFISKALRHSDDEKAVS